MLRLSLALAAVSMIAAPVGAVPCRDAKTHRFIKCPPSAVVLQTGAVTKDKNGKCHFASGPKKGQFTKCP